MEEIINKIGNFFKLNGYNILASIAILVIGFFLIKLLCKLFMKIVYSTKIDNAIGGFVVSIIKVLLWILLFFAIASLLGISENSFLVAFSSVALAIGLALKDSLANIANGIVIIMIKPFKKGDHVSVDGNEGVIKNINILTTEIVTFDNKRLVLPNSKITTSTITNFTSNPTRRLDFHFGVSYESDMELVKKVLYEAVLSMDYTIKNPAPFVYMECHNASSVDFCCKFWVNTSDYWNAYYQLNEVVFALFKKNNIEIPYPQLDVHFNKGVETNAKD